MTANSKNKQLSKTATVVKATAFIPAGAKIKQNQVSVVQVPEALAQDLAKSPEEVVGKASKVSILEGQFVPTAAIEPYSRKTDMVEICVPTDISSSACVLAGEIVDLYVFSKGTEAILATEVYRGARVMHAYDQNGMEIAPAGKTGFAESVQPGANQAPVSVGIEVPREVAPRIVDACSKKCVYLVKSAEVNN